ncbi:MAG TPA: matrixin family metalloprotease [Candidatus Binatia bacterium]|nr:matrixin family metalloprotease [Candidatus Binatia bacterium]
MASRKWWLRLVAGREALVLGVVFTGWALLFSAAEAFVRETTTNSVPLSWPDAQATLNLRLGCPAGGSLANWGPCWDDTATDAAARWTNAGARFRFFRQMPSVTADPCAHFDGKNTLAFQSTFCGMAFGDGLAVTAVVFNSTTGALVEADTLFDAGRSWSTYPGPLQRNASGQVTAYDLHRVAIHELGHALGLDHPDTHGQSVAAIMNSRVSDIDDVQPDDIAGVNAIYPSAAPSTGVLENPQPDSFQSGVATISGWVCNAQSVQILVDGTARLDAAYGTAREDTRSVCGKANTGFGVLFNWNLLGNGSHTVALCIDNVCGQPVPVHVSTYGQEFLRGVNGGVAVCTNKVNPPFPATTILVWQESQQNFAIALTLTCAQVQQLCTPPVDPNNQQICTALSSCCQ